MTRFVRRRLYRINILFCCILIGCATWSNHGVVLHAPQKLRIAVLPVRSLVEIKKLNSIRTIPESEPYPPNEKELIRQQMQKVTEEMTRSLEERLNASYFFEVVLHSQVQEAMASLGIQPSNSPLTPDQIKGLGETLKVQALMITELSGYGQIKKKWLVFLIGTGVVEGAVEGVLAAKVVKNNWVAVGVAAEEILQETLTWTGGVFLFNKIFTPVILEGKLVSTNNGKAIWKKTAFARINRKALKKFPEEERGKKEIRLQVTSEKAQEELIKSLEKRAFSNVQ